MHYTTKAAAGTDCMWQRYFQLPAQLQHRGGRQIPPPFFCDCGNCKRHSLHQVTCRLNANLIRCLIKIRESVKGSSAIGLRRQTVCVCVCVWMGRVRAGRIAGAAPLHQTLSVSRSPSIPLSNDTSARVQRGTWLRVCLFSASRVIYGDTSEWECMSDILSLCFMRVCVCVCVCVRVYV